MTQQEGTLGPADIPRPPDWYWTARGMAEMRAQTVRAIGRGVDHAIRDFGEKLDVMQKALGLVRQRDPEKRLLEYYNKPDTYAEALEAFAAGLIKVPYSWESQASYFPRDYEEDWADFSRLRARAAKGDFGPAMVAQEQTYMEPGFEGALPSGVYPEVPESTGGGSTRAEPIPNIRLTQPYERGI